MCIIDGSLIHSLGFSMDTFCLVSHRLHPVSYTHLDVYKRQPHRLYSVYLLQKYAFFVFVMLFHKENFEIHRWNLISFKLLATNSHHSYVVFFRFHWWFQIFVTFKKNVCCIYFKSLFLLFKITFCIIHYFYFIVCCSERKIFLMP